MNTPKKVLHFSIIVPCYDGKFTLVRSGFADERHPLKAGKPPDIIDKLNAAFGAVIASPEYAAMEARAKSKSFMCSPQELGRFAQAETQKWADLVKLAGIEKE